jgi:hypothetical protein
MIFTKMLREIFCKEIKPNLWGITVGNPYLWEEEAYRFVNRKVCEDISSLLPSSELT